ncbi:MAG: endolytic transglycosylase MltG [Terriglobales bacterium]
MKLLRFIAIAALLCIAAGFLLLYLGWDNLNEAIQVDTRKLVQVPLGATPDEAITAVSDAGIITQKLPLRIYMKLTGSGPRIKAGDYYFSSPISPLAVLQKLEEGGQGANKITVIEGWNRWDIATAMSEISTFKLKDADQAFKRMYAVKEIKDLDPSATSLEGYMFPDTYFVYSNSTAADLIQQMVQEFHKVWNDKLAAKAKQEKKSVHDVVTVASIIETEAKLPEERRIVASVIYNRLKKSMPLSVDSTIVYASKLAGKWKNDGKVYQSDIDRDSPYNTRKYKGLPPGPVGCPGLPSLEAAINPANTDYLYYVRDPDRDDGAHNFYKTSEDFENGVKALRDWEQRQKEKQDKIKAEKEKQKQKQK